MLISTITQMKVVHNNDPEKFEKEFNSVMADLADKKPQFTLEVTNGFTALITYTETIQQMDCIADEYHAEGIKYTCQQCPLREVQPDGRKKDAECKFSETGKATLKSEACEVFYRQLKLGAIEPIGEPKKIKENSWRKRNYEQIRQERQVNVY